MATPQRFLSLSRIGNATAENLTVLPSSVRALAHRAAVFCALILPMWPTGRLHHVLLQCLFDRFGSVFP